MQPSLAEDARVLAGAVGQLVSITQFRDRDRVAPHGLSAGQWYALRAVAEVGGLTVNQLAGVLYVDKSTASRIASGLVDRELLVREPQVDARSVRLSTTPAGQALHATIRADEERDFASLLGHFDGADRAELCRAMSRLREQASAGVETAGGSCWVVL